MFNDIVLEHFRNPHNAGDQPGATAVMEVCNPVCGDFLRLSVLVEDGRIVAARFKTQGCVASIAASSVLTDMLARKTLAEAADTKTPISWAQEHFTLQATDYDVGCPKPCAGESEEEYSGLDCRTSELISEVRSTRRKADTQKKTQR